jgi:hypothetical protein
MRTWLRPLVSAIVGKVPGKTDRPDTATRMAIDADFSDRGRPRLPEPSRKRERDDRHLVKPLEPSADIALFEQLLRIVNEAQDRDAEDERRLYGPMRVAGPSPREQGRLDPGSRY